MAEPKVRFKKDDGGAYPAWTAGKLGDITEKVDRKAPKGSTAPVMMVSQGNGFIYQADKYSRENAGQSLKNYTLLKQGEFAYNHGASKAKPYGVAYCLTEESEARVPFVYHTFRLTDGVNPYWHEALNTSKMDRKLKRMVSSGARMDGLLNINYDTYMDVDVNIPCVEEQQKIADFLSSVDEVITASEEEVANLETQKKAVMKKIFTQEVRFKRADGSDFSEWEEKRLGEIADVSKLAGFEFTKYVTYSESGNIIAIRGLNVKSGRLILDDVKYLDGSDFSKLERSKLYVDDIMFTYVGTIGDAALVPDNDKYYMAPNVCRIRVADELPGFIMQQLLSDWFKKTIIKPLIATSSQPALSMDNIRIFKMCIPCLEEQRLIADFLSDFDEAIEAAKKELELWKELKKGLLQQMFV